ncbi:MAG TPA: GNAT family N-acetyltransferase [Pirellulales bacterium]|nr:GNAT family N-acetyltransferase [Pirellulales bacterium]
MNCRPYQPGDEHGIFDLYRAVFQLEMTPEHWHWFFQSSPDGPAAISVMESGGRLVGHYAVLPRGFWFEQRRGIAGLAAGAMLLPEARSVPALVQLAKLAYEIARQRGMTWLYAFPRDDSHAVHCKLLGWKAMPKIVEWDGALPRGHADSAKNVHVWRQMPADLDFNDLNPAGDVRAICGLRSTDWLRWRFFDRPGGEYVLHTIADGRKATAYAVTKRYQRDGVRYGHLLDWRSTPAATKDSEGLLASVWRQLADDWQVERVSTWAKGRSVLGAVLAGAGLTLTGRNSNFCYFDVAGVYNEFVEDSAWQLEMADSDIY